MRRLMGCMLSRLPTLGISGGGILPKHTKKEKRLKFGYNWIRGAKTRPLGMGFYIYIYQALAAAVILRSGAWRYKGGIITMQSQPSPRATTHVGHTGPRPVVSTFSCTRLAFVRYWPSYVTGTRKSLSVEIAPIHVPS